MDELDPVANSNPHCHLVGGCLMLKKIDHAGTVFCPWITRSWCTLDGHCQQFGPFAVRVNSMHLSWPRTRLALSNIQHSILIENIITIDPRFQIYLILQHIAGELGCSSGSCPACEIAVPLAPPRSWDT